MKNQKTIKQKAFILLKIINKYRARNITSQTRGYMQSPVNEFSECNECGAAKGVECNDCLSHSSRIHNFIAKAAFDERLKAQQLT